MLQKKQIFKNNVLKEFLTEEFSCVTLVRTNRLLALPPCYLNDIKGGILFLLNNILKKYDRSLDGILIGFQNVKILLDENTGLVPMGVGETRVNISVEFYIFQPKIGGFLQGVVNKKSNNHIGCLVHCYFNATILKPDNVEYEDWIGKDINVRDKIIFKVKDLDFTGLLPSIEGTIEESVNNIKLGQEPNISDASDAPKNCSDKKEHLNEKNSRKRKLKTNSQSPPPSSSTNDEENVEENVFHSTQICPSKKIKIDFCSPIQPEVSSKSKKDKRDRDSHKKVKSKHKEKNREKKLLEEVSEIDGSAKRKKKNSLSENSKSSPVANALDSSPKRRKKNSLSENSKSSPVSNALDSSPKRRKKNSLSETSKSSPVSHPPKESIQLEKPSKDDFRENLILKLQAEALESLSRSSSSQCEVNIETVKTKKSKSHKKDKKSSSKKSTGDLYSKLLSDAMNSINYSGAN